MELDEPVVAKAPDPAVMVAEILGRDGGAFSHVYMSTDQYFLSRILSHTLRINRLNGAGCCREGAAYRDCCQRCRRDSCQALRQVSHQAWYVEQG